MLNDSKKLAVALLLLSCCGFQSASAEAGKRLVTQIVDIFAAHTTVAGMAGAADPKIDYLAITRQAFKPEQWKSFSPAQQQKLSDDFRRYVQARYYMRWHKLFGEGHLAVADEARQGDSTFVRSYLKHGQQQDTVIWKFGPRDTVTDLTVNGKDLIERLSETAQPQLEKRGPQQFVAWMEQEAQTAQKRENEAAANASARQAM